MPQQAPPPSRLSSPSAHTGLRGPEEQALLAELAGCPGVHLAASVDHINAPLLWDVKTRASFR